MFSYEKDYVIKRWERQNSQGCLETRIPARKDLVKEKFNIASIWPDHWQEEINLMNDVAIAEPFCPNWDDVKNALAAPLQKIILKENITREEIKDILDQTAEELYAEYPEVFSKK